MKIMFFSPFSAIWQHAFPEALVANSLFDDNEILYLACDGELGAGCMSMFAHQLTEKSNSHERENVCNNCRQQRNLLTEALNVKPAFIKDYISNEEMSLVESLLSGIQKTTPDKFYYEGFPFGRYALHETIIHYKLTNLSEMDEEEFSDFCNNLKNVLIVFFAIKHYVAEHNPDRVVTYNTHVSTQYTVMNFCESQGIPVYGLHAGMNMACRLQSLYVFRQDMRVFYNRLIQNFEKSLSDEPCDKEGLENVARHFLSLCQGRNTFVYSAPKSKSHFDLHDFFSVKAGQKVLLATMSSYDEFFSSETLGVHEEVRLLFPKQVDWIKSVVDYVAGRPDLFLIIRVHPREFPNKRENRLSNHAKLLEEEWKKGLPDNVVVNSPTDNISIYDLAMETDVVLNGWSSVGKEMSLLGIPVVIYNSDILYYPGKILNYLGDTKESYFEKIEKALSDGWSFDRAIKTFRWLAWEYTYATLDISDGYPRRELSEVSIASRIWGRLSRFMNPQGEQKNDCKRLKRIDLSQKHLFVQAIMEGGFVPDLQWSGRESLSESEEKVLIAHLLRRIVRGAYSDSNAMTSMLVRKINKAVDEILAR